MKISILTALGCFIITGLLTGVIKRYAYKLNLIDIPNDRSSHDKPTPRAGGFAFVLSFLLGLGILYYYHIVSFQLLMAFLGGGVLIAFVGFIDDINHVPAAIRILIHFIAAIWVIWIFKGMPALALGFFTWHWHLIGMAVGIVGLIWLINLYNFMDGIDGLATSEAIFVAIAAIIIFYLQPHRNSLEWIALLLAASVSGFAIWNWPPAKIFMGDTGSGFLGYVFGVFLIANVNDQLENIWIWLLLLGVFWVDATVTLFRRIYEGEKWYQAHRSHAFQIAATKYNSHWRVVMGVAFINVIWLLPMAIGIVYFPKWSILIFIAALIPLLFLWHFFNVRRNASSLK